MNYTPPEPNAGTVSLRTNWKQELISGLTVALVALPLCLGFAMASGVPVIAGLIAAIVGGLFTAGISGTNLTISGPAAGLIVITMGAVTQLGMGDPIAGYKFTIAAIAIAGLIMFTLGLLGIGKLGDFFPTTGIHGMLAAIGVLIISGQLFVAVGTKSGGVELLEILHELPHLYANFNPAVAVIALTSILVLIFHAKTKIQIIRIIPAPIWVLVITIPMAHGFNFFEPHNYIFAGKAFHLGPELLVHLPGNLLSGLTFPDFGKVGERQFWSSVVQFALVAGLETILISKAIDGLDPLKRKSNFTKNLGAMGLGTAVSGMLGGLPIISEIVRSSANVKSGALTRWSNFFHGLFLLLFLVFLKDLLEQIPMAALAGMLIYTGFSLASPAVFRHARDVGNQQLLVFLVTMITVLLTDIILGVLVGILVLMALHLLRGVPLKSLITVQMDEFTEDGITTIILFDGIVFSNYLSFKKLFLKFTDSKEIHVDFSEVRLVDHTVMNHLELLKREMSYRGTQVKWLNMEHLEPVSRHPLATRVKVSRAINLQYRLNSRQEKLSRLAEEEHFTFDPKPHLGVLMFGRSYFGFGKNLHYLENKMTYAGSPSETANPLKRIMACDLYLEEGAQITKQETTMTIMTLAGDWSQIPDFMLRPAHHVFLGIMEKLAGPRVEYGVRDAFSDKFILNSKEPERVTALFDQNLKSLLLAYPGYHLECHGKLIFVHFNKKLLNSDQMKEMLSFGRELSQLLTENYLIPTL